MPKNLLYKEVLVSDIKINLLHNKVALTFDTDWV